MARSRRGRLFLMTLVTVLATAGCSGTPDPESRSAPPSEVATPAPHGVRLSFVQQRFDEGTARANVRVGNHTRRLLRVRTVGVDWPGFPGRPQRVDYAVPGGLTIDLRYVLPRPDCSEAAGRAPAHAVVTTGRRTIRQPMPRDGMGFLTRIWRTTCNQQRIAGAVTLGFGDTWHEEDGDGLDGVMRGRLLVQRRAGDEQVEVAQIEGSLLFGLELRGPAVLPPAEDRLAVPVEVTPGRCDEHGRSQVTQTFVFRVWVQVGGEEPLVRNLVPTRSQQARMLEFIDRVCG